MRWLLALFFTLLVTPALAKVMPCGGVVAPGLAYPDVNGTWSGLEISLCQDVASAAGETSVFTPILQDSDTPPPDNQKSLIFVPAGDIAKGYNVGPVIFNDYQALMVPDGSKVRTAADLANASICVEPGSPEDFNLTAYFAAHHIALREFVFQETDEMHDAYVAHRCDAITARKSLLIGLRANEDGARKNDIILPDNLGDNPVRGATPAGQTAWAQTVATIIQEQTNVASSHP
ncbi:MAG: transporter substrate-binding domain-containing protein [Acidocella sp.]|nr:transporter substrate-binding domain-containing protein [Acidocella sp.]